MSAEYIVERHPLGWLLCAPPGQDGIPLAAFAECRPLFKKGSMMSPGIAHHFNASRRNKRVVMAVVTPGDSEDWEKEIAAELEGRDPQDRWWLGTDVGRSSAALFHVLCHERLKWETDNFGQKAAPQDADDFGRCKRLLGAIPEWRGRLNEVAVNYAGTAWPEIVARWDELEAAGPARQTEILRECHNVRLSREEGAKERQ